MGDDKEKLEADLANRECLRMWQQICEQLEAEWDEEDKRFSGWMCPRCQAVHAPWVDKCDCEPKALASVGPSEFK